MRLKTAISFGVAVVGTVVLVTVADQGSHSVSDTQYHAVIPVALLWLAAGVAIALSRGRGTL